MPEDRTADDDQRREVAAALTIGVTAPHSITLCVGELAQMAKRLRTGR